MGAGATGQTGYGQKLIWLREEAPQTRCEAKFPRMGGQIGPSGVPFGPASRSGARPSPNRGQLCQLVNIARARPSRFLPRYRFDVPILATSAGRSIGFFAAMSIYCICPRMP